MKERIIQYTKSLSPLSLNIIDAYIASDGNNVYMVKKDENEEEYKTLIEKDPDLYALLTKQIDAPPTKIQSIYTYVSSKCNLNCKICYEGYGEEKEVSANEFKELLEKYRDCKVLMMGKEPTCRDDIVRFIEQAGDRTCLLTNGIKLENAEYVKRLKKHGLKKVFFSFNGLNNEVYRKMNGGNYYDVKLKALKNLENEEIDTVLSATIAKNINEDQILPLIKFCLEHRSFIFELRIRTLSPIGKHLDSEQICLSELINMIADSLLIRKTDIMKEFYFIQAFIENFKWLLPEGFINKYRPKLCSFIFHIKKEDNGKYSSPGLQIDLEKINNSLFKSLYFIYYLVKVYGFALLAESALNVLNLKRFLVQKTMLTISLKYWPNLYNVDLNEMNKCPNMYYKDGKMEKFCLSNIKFNAKKM
jgi:uncharacterized radical SAM superfamily Fe-S cluster-containing enzyme